MDTVSAGASGRAAEPMWCYRLGRALYVHVTASANSVTLIQSRGPGFKTVFLPAGVRPGAEPSDEELFQEVQRELAREPADAVVFAGLGEPTMRLGTLVALGSRLRGLAPELRLNTNGLGSLQHARDIVPELTSAGFSRVSVALNAAGPARHRCAMRPRVGGRSLCPAEGFEAVCSFVRAACAAFPAGNVEVTCVEAPGVDVAAAEHLVRQLTPVGAAAAFRTRSFHPLAPTEGVATVAHSAAHAGNTDVLASLCHQALVAPDDQGNPPIVWAGNAGHAEAIRLLVERGCPVDAPGRSGNTALHRACNQAHATVVSALIEARADVNVLNSKQQTPLHHAAFYQHRACVAALVDAGADPTKTDGRGKTPAEDTADMDVQADLVVAVKHWQEAPRL
ncbi:unnamed protein product [Prorocentrum cordatum]|uniref:Uncharacterized protein n=1 Tax=Prorocentrum cordatum TaxID=2364126 RepID=A0ABN9VNI3_9DINO|nr:unnamed protein product [Polarella glacialis]